MHDSATFITTLVAGLVLSKSEISHKAADRTLPLRDAFAVIFFVSAGMSFNPTIIVEKPLLVLGVVAILMAGKSLAAAAILYLFKKPLDTKLTIAASLARIGAFSFILAGAAPYKVTHFPRRCLSFAVSFR